MLQLFAVLLLLFQTPAPQITSPKSGETLRGVVNITGATDIPGFSSAEIAFAYGTNAPDPGQNWFTLQTFSQPQADSPLINWDTSAITDGEYSLRLRVFSSDGSLQDVYVTGLQVRNDEAPPTNTPLPATTSPAIDLPQPTITPVPTAAAAPVLVFPTPTAFPVNPASLAPGQISFIFTRAASASFVLFILFSLILRLRKARS